MVHTHTVCFELLYSVALWHGDQAALYRAIRALRETRGSPACVTFEGAANNDLG